MERVRFEIKEYDTTFEYWYDPKEEAICVKNVGDSIDGWDKNQYKCNYDYGTLPKNEKEAQDRLCGTFCCVYHIEN